MSSLRVVAAAGAAILLYAVWRLFGHYLFRSPLDNVPGPPPVRKLLGL